MLQGEKREHRELSMEGPATYMIRVRGHLPAERMDRLGGMNVTYSHVGSPGEVTVLVGRLADQAALKGVLDSLYSLHLPVLSAKCLEPG